MGVPNDISWMIFTSVAVTEISLAGLTVRGDTILGENAIMPDKTGLVECTPLNCPGRSAPTQQYLLGPISLQQAQSSSHWVFRPPSSLAQRSPLLTGSLLTDLPTQSSTLYSHDLPHLLHTRLIKPHSPLPTPLRHILLQIKVPTRHTRRRLVREGRRAQRGVVAHSGRELGGEHAGEEVCEEGKEAGAMIHQDWRSASVCSIEHRSDG